MVSTATRYLVVGCGGVGGIVASYLLAAGRNVTIVSPNERITHAVRRRGLKVRGATCLRWVPAGEVYRELPDDVTPFDTVFLATPPTEAEAAARSVASHLVEGGQLVCLQNGLCEPRVADVVGNEKVLGAVVTWGASMPEVGVYDRTSSGGFVVGRWGAPPDAAVRELARDLSLIGKSQVTDDLSGMRWTKLAINCAVSTLGTISGQRLGRLLYKGFVRQIALDLLSEVVRVGHAEGVQFQRLNGVFDIERMAALDQTSSQPQVWLRHALLCAVGLRYRRLRSSMLAAIERGRVPPIDYLNGEIVTRAERLGLDVPVNRAARDAVWALSRGELEPSVRVLSGLVQPKTQLRGSPTANT